MAYQIEEESVASIERLASNPHYKLNPKQVRILEEHRRKQYKRPSVLHKTGINKHDPSIKNVHSPELEVENGRTNRN